VLLCAEVLVLLVLAVAGLADPAAGVPLSSLSVGELFGHPGVGALLVIALLGYVGFEAAAVFSEEARIPRRTVPVAVYTSLALIGAIYALASWAMSVHYDDDQVAAVAAEQGPGMLFAMSGSVVAEIATVLFITSLFAAMISFHNAVARYLVAPALAALLLLAMVWSGLANYATLLGVAPGSTEAWALPAAFAVVAVVGVAYGLWLRSARPDVTRASGSAWTADPPAIQGGGRGARYM
jgi:hypothetical protein